ncbi:MAG: alanine--tRNA ligase [Legionellales bacterium]|nr:alanine--tRNA ligase [Legionellales bacterium]
MKSSEIRQAFLDYFAKKGHQVVASSSLVPGNDPTLLFTNAGMVQFKDTFLGIEARPYVRAVSSQRCVRAGGKHNDLDNVGYTARHHTFFEMLGNFSFGDYFKREAIAYAWEFLTTVLHLPPERLWVTVYQEDDETADIWLNEMGISKERFSRCGAADNFWSMGDTGPCGPCTEIFYDHGPEIPGGPPGSPDDHLDRYIEIWNLVFMQFNRDKEGHFHPLPKTAVDTGMGLERITAVVQGVHNNYDIDGFQVLISTLATWAAGVDKTHPSLKVIADHIRACAFLIADGVLPSNEGRGYVLRRIIRRAVRHGVQLGLASPFFSKLVEPLGRVMGEAYPELVTERSHIERILEQEENQFSRTLEQGLCLLQEQIQGLKGKEIKGEVAFKLYDTYGFPLDLTADIAREKGLQVDMTGFERCMQRQREQSQLGSQFGDGGLPAHWAYQSHFHGYQLDKMSSEVTAMLCDGVLVSSLQAGMKAGIVLADTPFYAESGGQVGDRGRLVGKTAHFRVEDTKKLGGAFVHYGELISGELQIGTTLLAEVDALRRDAIRLNHTATHLLYAALKQIVGEHVQQKGSLVDAGRARFDFAHDEALTTEQLQQIEDLVNEKIRGNLLVTTTLMSLDEAKQSGAVALFGEKYSDEVRVLSLDDFSKELCGGTHVKQTGDIGFFKIVSESGIASGVRRIELVTGAEALHFVNEQQGVLEKMSVLLKTVPHQLLEKGIQWMQEMKLQEKELTHLKQRLAVTSSQALRSQVQNIGKIQVLVSQVDVVDVQELRALLDQLKSSLQDAVIVLVSVSENKMNVVAAVSPSILGKVPTAALLVKHLCGKGGGRDDMAQGGGIVPPNLKSKMAEIATMVQ